MIHFNKACSKFVIERVRLFIIIIVTAIWKDYAQQGMKEATSQSGILDNRPAGPTMIAFGPEVEAATLASPREKGQSVGAGDVFVTCDTSSQTVTG